LWNAEAEAENAKGTAICTFLLLHIRQDQLWILMTETMWFLRRKGYRESVVDPLLSMFHHVILTNVTKTGWCHRLIHITSDILILTILDHLLPTQALIRIVVRRTDHGLENGSTNVLSTTAAATVIMSVRLLARYHRCRVPRSERRLLFHLVRCLLFHLVRCLHVDVTVRTRPTHRFQTACTNMCLIAILALCLRRAVRTTLIVPRRVQVQAQALDLGHIYHFDQLALLVDLELHPREHVLGAQHQNHTTREMLPTL